MEFQFSAGEWERLTLAERAQRCRILAGEAETLASRESSYSKTLYLELAMQWKMLAEEIGPGAARISSELNSR